MSDNLPKPTPEIQAIIDKAEIPAGTLSRSEVFQRLSVHGMSDSEADHWAAILCERDAA